MGIKENSPVPQTTERPRKLPQTQEEFIRWIETTGPLMVVDPEKAVHDLENTIEKVRIAARSGVKSILIGGSTGNGEAQTVIPRLREAIDDEDGDTILVGFPGASHDIAEGLHVILELLLDQFELEDVFNDKPDLKRYLYQEHDKIKQMAEDLNVHFIPTKYILFDAGGEPTSVQKATSIKGFDVSQGISKETVEQIMAQMEGWFALGQLVILELGSSPSQRINLGLIAKAIFEITKVYPVITGGVGTPDMIKEITDIVDSSTGAGTALEIATPHEFEERLNALREAHPLTRKRNNL